MSRLWVPEGHAVTMSDATPPAGQSRWIGISTGHRVAKAAGGLVTFAGAVLGIVVALDQLGVIDPLGGTENALAAAAAKTSDAGSATIDLARTIQTESTVVEDQAHGEFDFRAEVGTLDHANGLQQRFIKPYLYQLGAANRQVWCQYDLSILGRGFLFGALTGFENDPGKALANLDEYGSHDEVGEETLFGVTTTHYSGNVELGQLVEQEENRETRELLEAFSQYNAGQLPVEVWISSDEFVRRLRTSFDIPGEDYGVAGRVHIDATFDFSDFGTQVEVTQPGSETISPPGQNGCPLQP